VTEYLCRECKKWIFSCDAKEGRIRLACRYCGAMQMLFLGNPGGRPLPRELRAGRTAC
jgi:DNA-directed RNA polymerase subunit RPC12/RpoP